MKGRESYMFFILRFAKLVDKNGNLLFCIHLFSCTKYCDHR